jgi:hypothetical protein
MVVGIWIIRLSPSRGSMYHQTRTCEAGAILLPASSCAATRSGRSGAPARRMQARRSHPRGSQGRFMHDPASGLRRRPLPRTWVNKGTKKDRRPEGVSVLPRKADADAPLTTVPASETVVLFLRGASRPRRAVRPRTGERVPVAAPSLPRWAALREPEAERAPWPARSSRR